MSQSVKPAAPLAGRLWELDRRDLTLRGVRRSLRLVRFASGWLASIDTESGPTLAANHSPYLALHGALEPLEIGIVESMTLVGPILTGRLKHKS